MQHDDPADQPTVGRASDPDRDVNAFLNQVDIALVDADLGVDHRPLLHVSMHDGQDLHATDQNHEFIEGPRKKACNNTLLQPSLTK